ncbi:phosphogluconate dehydrogenase (NAD(+)-dependent, decarboxylating) [Lysobacter niastensis]|uniref:Decarboxylating 6-phosphogluconate dehydrogenase n=1 Tax=Lysobacter niastensis TaxID=380629 RepID=A0ABS0B7L8_9GAMM|nr:decarboxylating 6-phosphogluconate dehydrogenase [Lysobacter niastensis]MBF6025029.1 decarboxylating 6-phosphogluconate dehydrogenase [Lysobacter niastensis]
MELGMVGLGRMGANMAERLVGHGHHVVGFDPGAKAREQATARRVVTAGSLVELVAQLLPQRVLWLMVPAGEVVDATIAELLPLLSEGDVVIDGGNSNYKDTMRRGAMLAGHGIHYLDCGTSGGIWGLKEGYSLMIGGDEAAVERLRPIFSALAPAPDRGWGRVGPSGAGHFTKMIHNGIEYGMMQAYAEGFAIMQRKTALGLDLQQVAHIWQHGSVVRSWLLDRTADALDRNPRLDGIAPHVSDSGEGRWTVAEAIDLDVSAPVITLSLLERLRSREDDSFADKLLAAMRAEFGGHAIKRSE